MDNPTSIKGLMQQMLPKGNDIVIGRVISVNPVRVQVINDEKLTPITIVPQRLSDLHTGEYVHLLVFNNGKKYYALDRAVM